MKPFYLTVATTLLAFAVAAPSFAQSTQDDGTATSSSQGQYKHHHKKGEGTSNGGDQSDSTGQ